MKRTILEDINLIIPMNDKVAITGPSGSGKSTLAKLIVDFYQPTSGKIIIGEMNAKEVHPNEIREMITYISQDTYLFEGTLRDNILFGLNHLISDQKILSVLKNIGLINMINEHPLGLNMPIEEAGDNLSGGQKQRIAIARALLKDSSVIIFDEATSSMEYELEEQIIQYLLSIETKTIIIITHHLINEDKFNQVIHLNQGRSELKK